jgi:hypothetical protein
MAYEAQRRLNRGYQLSGKPPLWSWPVLESLRLKSLMSGGAKTLMQEQQPIDGAGETAVF